MTSFQVLSHAGLRVTHAGKTLLIDPWLKGSCYWRSWWNYPPVDPALYEGLRPDAIYLTHIHWDHFQSVSLKLFPKDTQILVPHDRYERIVRDLNGLGFTNVRELKHRERYEIVPNLAVRSYHFGPFLLDSAPVIEAGDTVLFDANDAKFAGPPLRQILNDYSRIDFAFRSHSSANPRVCYHYLDAADEPVDDNEHYLRAFALFMERVRPRYAIPFASNHCHLHRGVVAFNDIVNTPLAVKAYFERFCEQHDLPSELKVMVSGDSWDSEDGFSLAQQDYFTNRQTHLATYAERKRETLESYYEQEQQVKIPDTGVAKFFARASKNTPWPFKRALKNENILIKVLWPNDHRYYVVDFCAGTCMPLDEANVQNYEMRIEIPAIVFRDAMRLNMWDHAGISKRLHFYATKQKMPTLKRFVQILSLMEFEVLPVGNFLRWRIVSNYRRRWREVWLYLQVISRVLRGTPLYRLEEDVLRST